MGAAGAANPETLWKWVSPERVWPPDGTNPIWMAHGAWWINRPQVDMLFGPVEDLGDFLVASQHLQCEGLRYALEAARRRQWRCAGTIIWQFNDCYPTTSCTCVLDYDLQPKPAFSAVRRAYGPVVATARYDGLDWHGREAFEAGVYVSSAVPEAGPATVRAQLLDLAGAVRFEQEGAVELGAPGTVHAFDVRWPLAGLGAFILRVSVENPHAAADRVSDILLSAADGPLFAEVWAGAPVPLAVRRGPEGVTVRNEGDRLAPTVFVSLRAPDGSARIPEDNAFALRPGEERWVYGPEEGIEVSVRGFRVEQRA
jgi:beta-mannosidase